MYNAIQYFSFNTVAALFQQLLREGPAPQSRGGIVGFLRGSHRAELLLSRPPAEVASAHALQLVAGDQVRQAISSFLLCYWCRLC